MSGAAHEKSPRVITAASKRAAGREAISDLLKAIAIVGVVCIHVQLPGATAFRFGVPTFITLWAYYCEIGLSRRAGREQFTYLRTRFVKIFVPYAFWSALYILLFHPRSEWHTASRHDVLDAWIGGYGWDGQYFFIVLFQLFAVIPLLRRVVRPATLWPIVAVGCVANFTSCYLLSRQHLVDGLGERLFVYWISYVALGIAFARGYPRRWPALLIVAIALLAIAPFEKAWLDRTVANTFIYLCASVTLGSLALLIAVSPRRNRDRDSTRDSTGDSTGNSTGNSRWRPHGWPLALSNYLGRNTMAIFVCHPALLYLALRIGWEQGTNLPSIFLLRGAEVIAAILCSLLVAECLRRIRLGILVGGA
jgi:surface polysaccharide O-acyltransferase-like enzyme